MPRTNLPRRPGQRFTTATRVLVTAAGAAALLAGPHAGADPRRDEWFGSPVSGTIYRIEHDATTREKSLVAPDGRSFPSIASIIEAESLALTPLERLMPADLRAQAADPKRADELVDVTFIYRKQPLHAAGVAARERAEPKLMAALERQHRILDRIAPLRTLPNGRAPDVATAMRDEAALLTDEEKKTLREVRNTVHDVLGVMRREALAEAAPLVKADQAALAAYVKGLPRALDLGGTVVLSARSARIPARALSEIAERFPEVMRIERVGLMVGCLDTAVSSVGASSWWNAGYTGASNGLIGLIDSGVDTSHPALANVVTASQTIHTLASTSATYGDNANSTDDLQGHGTNTAGILCSSDSTYRGIAYGGHILNAKGAYFDTALGQARAYTSDTRLASDWACNNGATVQLITFGGQPPGTGTDEGALFFDMASSALGVAGVIAAKNDGPSSGTSGYPGGAFNVLTCGNIDDGGTSSLSDDIIYNTSGRGPTGDGRQKPDIAAPGVNITTTAHDHETGPDFVTISPGTSTGTSMVGPLVAGAIALLQDYGAAAYPPGVKALLLTTANNTSPYSGPNNNFGFGALDCAGAYTYRNSVYEGQLTSSGPRFVLLKGGTLTAGKRATLVWSRQVVSNGSNIPTTYYTPQDLDLYVYEESTGGQVTSSANTVNPQEQVAVGSTVTSPVYKVYLASPTFTSSYSTEPFAVAAESTSSTSEVAPTLVCTFTTFTNSVQGVADTSVTVTVTNSGGVKAFAPSVTLTLPATYTLVAGNTTQTPGDIAAGANASVQWTIRSPSGPSGSYPVQAAATTTSFGETFVGATATKNQLIDNDNPTGSISIAAGASFTPTRDVSVTMSATDPTSLVSKMRLRNAGDPWPAVWIAYATTASITLPAGDGTKTVEGEFQDEAGNSSTTYLDTITLDNTPPSSEMTIMNGADFTSSASVTLNSNSSDIGSGVADASFSNDNVSFGAWTPYAASLPWTMASGEGTKTVYARYRDGAGFVSVTTSDTIVVDTSPPSGSISIAGGASGTALRGVTINLSASDSFSGMGEMRFSDDTITWSQYQTYGATAGWLLPPGDGTKTVYAQFKDAAGNVASPVSDTIVLDTTGPTGSVLVQGGADFATSTAVLLGLSATDTANGVAQMRFSNDQITFSPYQAYATSASWTLTPGDGLKTVSVQFKDGVGNASFFFTDTIKVDSTPPTGSMKILADAAAINTPNVSLDLTYADAVAGVAEVRMSNDGTTWSPWTAAGPIVPWMMTAGEGLKTVTVQYRDAAGNESATASDTIVVDTVLPTGSFVLAHDAAYVMPWETLTADTTASDGPLGSGVADFRSSADGGTTWSPWAPIVNGAAAVPRPAEGRDSVITIQGQFRDVAGNVSASSTDSSYLADDRAASVTLASAFSGTLGLNKDSDTVRIALLAGDKLTLKLKTKSLVKKADVRVDIDVFGPDHTKLITDRYPATGKKLGVTKYLAPATGEYWIVLRATGTKADTGITYTLSVSNAALKGSRARKGVATFNGAAVPPGTTVEFDAPDGFTLNGTLTGPMTVGSQPTLRAPDGSTASVGLVPGKKGAQKIVALKLAGGTGRYVLTIPSTGDVKYTIALSPGKLAKLNESTQ